MWSEPPSIRTQCAHADWGVLRLGDTQPSHRLWEQPARQLRLLRDFCSDLPDWIRRHRHGTVALVRCGTRRWAYRKSAIFTTVHSGARRTSEPETSLSLSWRKFVASSFLFHTHKYGEIRVRTKFRIVSKTEIKSRSGKRANQDSPWKTKRANSCWSQIWDPEARTSSRVWQKKYPGVEWNYWVLAKGNWSCYCKWWTTPTRSSTPSRTTIRTKSGSSWSSYQKSSWYERIEESARVTNRWIFEKKIDRRSRDYSWIHGQNSGTTEWSQLYEWLERFLRCWVSTQWTIPRSKSTSVFSILSWSWKDAKPSWRTAKPQQPAARYLEFAGFFGQRFVQIHERLLRHLILADSILGFLTQRKTHLYSQVRCDPLHVVNVRFQTQSWLWDFSRDRQPEIHSTLRREDSWRIMEQTNKDCSSELHFYKFLTPTTFAGWKIRFKTVARTCSQFPAEAMQWIKEVEMADSVDDLKSSRSIRGTPGPNFELLDARIASALNKIIQNTRFKKKVSLEETKAHKEDHFFRWRQIAYLIYECNYADLFTVALRNDNMGWNSIVDDTNPT